MMRERSSSFGPHQGATSNLFSNITIMKAVLSQLSLLFTLFVGVIHAQSPEGSSPQVHAEDWAYLDNGKIKLGVRRSSGAAIAFLAPSGSTRNLLNDYDRGRLVQQSYYGNRDGSAWVKQPWRYNPVQGGDYQGKGSRLLELRFNKTTLYSKSVPLHWATGEELSECVMEQWITLKDEIVHVRFQMTYSGATTHDARHQEIPAIFVDASLATLVTYTGNAPWTGAALTHHNPGPKNEYIPIPENWVAYVDAQNFGVGAYVPIATEATCYRYRGDAGSECSYVAPIATFALKPSLIFTYSAYFALGSPQQLREKFFAVSRSLLKEAGNQPSP